MNHLLLFYEEVLFPPMQMKLVQFGESPFLAWYSFSHLVGRQQLLGTRFMPRQTPGRPAEVEVHIAGIWRWQLRGHLFSRTDKSEDNLDTRPNLWAKVKENINGEKMVSSKLVVKLKKKRHKDEIRTFLNIYTIKIDTHVPD